MKKTALEPSQQSERLRQVKRRKGSTKKYFTKENEDAIVEFIQETCSRKRDRLFDTLIYPVFCEIINNIVNVYKFNYLPNLEDRKVECVRLLAEKIHYFDPTLGFKAFSYFSVITKHWWLNEAKKFKKTSSEEEVFEEDFVEIETCEEGTEEYLIRMEDWDEDIRIRLLILSELVRKDTNLSLVVDEIIHFFSVYKDIAISSYTRKAFVDHVSEKTGLSKQQVLNSLYRLKKMQKDDLDS
jgi:sulfur relay (sulfurtransferase) DsrC/TusE family protein